MKTIDISKIKKWYFVGIGGASMNGLAEMLLSHGCCVCGSDQRKTSTTEQLEKKGATIYYGHSSTNIKNPDCVVYSAAIAKSNEELLRARELGILCIERCDLLGCIMKQYASSTAIAGTNGKTTTSSMIAAIMLGAKMNPTVHVGGQLSLLGGKGVHIGGRGFFVTEACEYVDSFLALYPTIAVVLNIEYEHADYFASLGQLKRSFLEFMRHIPPDGHLVVDIDDANIRDILSSNKLPCKLVTYGLNGENNPNWTISSMRFNGNGCAAYYLMQGRQEISYIKLNVPGVYNVRNSLAAAVACHTLGCSANAIQSGLMEFTGVNRRFELKGNIGGIRVLDDYGHSPTAIKAVLEAVKFSNSGDLWCVFQPHTYTRTKYFLSEFANAFGQADHVVITDIYASREKDEYGVHAEDLVKLVRKAGKHAEYISNFEQLAAYLVSKVKPGDTVLTVGAGNVNEVGDIFIKKIRSSQSAYH